ncbi:hypothetical protein EFP34_04930 [Lacticaseibacillus paracasei]|nr:hypothetical protein [Lacticaseibacillus paracasei]
MHTIVLRKVAASQLRLFCLQKVSSHLFAKSVKYKADKQLVMREFEIRVVIRGSNQQRVVMGHFGWF